MFIDGTSLTTLMGRVTRLLFRPSVLGLTGKHYLARLGGAVFLVIAPALLGQDFGSSSSLSLVSGTVASQTVSPSNRTVTVIPGQSFSGSLTLRIDSTWPSNAVMAMGITPTWGDHASSFGDLGGPPTPVTNYQVTANFGYTAPSTPGTYYIIAAYRAEFTAAQVMSMTNWSYGSVVWNDGNDIADWSPAMIATANSVGRAQGSLRYPSGMVSYYQPATAITVVVSPPAGPEQTSALTLVGGSVASQSVNASNRTVTVIPGQSFSGSLTLRVDSTWPSSAVMAMGITPTWGDHASSFSDLGGPPTPVTNYQVTANFGYTAPATPGTYYIIAAFRAEYTAAQVMSMTNWSYGSVVWNDGNDMADWSPAMIATANSVGRAQGSLRYPSGMVSYYQPATAITLVVSPPPPCTEDAMTTCLINGRYRITSHWQNQYAGGAVSNLYKTKLTDATAGFWLFGSSTLEYLIRISTATTDGHAWIAIPTFTDVEFWIIVEDTFNGQSKTYHSPAGNKTLIYDPYFFIYP